MCVCVSLLTCARLSATALLELAAADADGYTNTMYV